MYFINVDKNVRCAVEDLNPSGRHVVLFVHGWPLNRQIFEYQYNVLPKYDVRCISYDLRGYGDSDKPWKDYSYDSMADDLHKIIQSLNVRSLTLLGFSMGGAICCRYMCKYNGFKVHKLVLCGAAVPSFARSEKNPYGMERKKIDELIQQTYQDRPAMCDAFGRLCFATKISEPYFRYFSSLCLTPAGYATIKSLEALRDEDLYRDLKQITVPTLIMHGCKDRVCAFQMAEESHNLIRNSSLIPFEYSSHCLFFEEKEKFNRELIDFIIS